MAHPDQPLLDHFATELGSVRMWRLTILSSIGLVLVLGLLVLLAGVTFSGSATLDDVGLPLGFLAVLTPILIGGLVYGIVRIRALGRHELLLALRVDPPAISRVEEVQNGGWWGVRFHLPSGGQYTFWAVDRGWVASVIARYRR
jgi:hypothetical protein